jgi:hypothetical protein
VHLGCPDRTGIKNQQTHVLCPIARLQLNINAAQLYRWIYSRSRVGNHQIQSSVQIPSLWHGFQSSLARSSLRRAHSIHLSNIERTLAPLAELTSDRSNNLNPALTFGTLAALEHQSNHRRTWSRWKTHARYMSNELVSYFLSLHE